MNCQILRKVNQTHFFRSSPTHEDIRKFNDLADHSFSTACIYYRTYQEAETALYQMENVPSDQRRRWSLSSRDSIDQD